MTVAPAIFTPNEKQLYALQLASPFAYQLWQRHERRLAEFLTQFPLHNPLSDVAELVRRYGANGDENSSANHGENGALSDAELMAALRILRQNLLVRWIWQDALGLIPLTRLMAELSDFADSCVLLAKAFMYQKLVTRFGRPYYCDGKKNRPDELAVLAMGKLGAQELNLSSDIDLIFIHQGAGQTSGAGGSLGTDTQHFMQLLGQGIIKLLNSVTADGFVFRVDMRLRPWGDGSALAMSLPALQSYLDKHGRTWERFAWLKMRVIGDIDEQFLAQLLLLRQNFVFRYYVDYSTFSALREMRTLIINQIAAREELDNIKLGTGGIRDVEFIAQSFALIYGGHHRVLTTTTACLPALALLEQLQILDAKTAHDLQQAYCFLRRLEHAIQARHDQQSQKLPTDNALLPLAQSLGFADGHALKEALARHRRNVSTPFDEMVMKRSYSKSTDHWDYSQLQQALAQMLDADSLAQLQKFWDSKLLAVMGKIAYERLKQAYPVIMQALLLYVQNGGQSALVLPRLIALLETIGRRSIYLVMLFENPKATQDLIPMLGQSPWIASELIAYPVLLDTFLQKRYVHLPNKQELRAILIQALLSVPPFDDEAFLKAIRLFKKTQTLAVATSDVLRHLPVMKVSDSLTFIAQVVLDACLRRAFVELTDKHGYPQAADGKPINEYHCGFAVIGYGKLGGIEMGYASDLDVVFLHRVAEHAQTMGAKPISGMKFAIRLAQKMMAYLSTQTRDGRAYELDMRLRPSGAAGVMVVALSAFSNYQQNQAWVWEHQALVRARGICGDGGVLESFAQIRQMILTQKRDMSPLIKEVLAMREKMHQHKKGGNDPAKFHLKKDAGGLIDIEFMAQFLVLGYAYHYPEMARWSDNVRIFETAEKQGVWDAAQCQSLIQAYLKIRKQVHKQALSAQKSLVDTKDWQDCRRQVMAIWQAVFALMEQPELCSQRSMQTLDEVGKAML